MQHNLQEWRNQHERTPNFKTNKKVSWKFILIKSVINQSNAKTIKESSNMNDTLLEVDVFFNPQKNDV